MKRSEQQSATCDSSCRDVPPPSHWKARTCKEQFENTPNCKRRRAGTMRDGYCYATCGACVPCPGTELEVKDASDQASSLTPEDHEADVKAREAAQAAEAKKKEDERYAQAKKDSEAKKAAEKAKAGTEDKEHEKKLKEHEDMVKARERAAACAHDRNSEACMGEKEDERYAHAEKVKQHDEDMRKRSEAERAGAAKKAAEQKAEEQEAAQFCVLLSAVARSSQSRLVAHSRPVTTASGPVGAAAIATLPLR